MTLPMIESNDERSRALGTSALVTSPSQPTATAPPHPRRWLMLAILFLVGTSSSTDRVVISVLLQPIKTEFGVSDTYLGLLSGLSFALLYSVLGLPIARWADRGDRRLLITIALTVWSGMTVLCAAATNFWQLLLARIGVGAGEAGATPPAQALIVDYFPPAFRARAVAIFAASGTVGYLLGLVVGSQLVSQYGWRATLVASHDVAGQQVERSAQFGSDPSSGCRGGRRAGVALELRAPVPLE
jgi:predicted MFS family arabinose efflux permease